MNADEDDPSRMPGLHGVFVTRGQTSVTTRSPSGSPSALLRLRRGLRHSPSRSRAPALPVSNISLVTRLPQTRPESKQEVVPEVKKETVSPTRATLEPMDQDFDRVSASGVGSTGELTPEKQPEDLEPAQTPRAGGNSAQLHAQLGLSPLAASPFLAVREQHCSSPQTPAVLHSDSHITSFPVPLGAAPPVSLRRGLSFSESHFRPSNHRGLRDAFKRLDEPRYYELQGVAPLCVIPNYMTPTEYNLCHSQICEIYGDLLNARKLTNYTEKQLREEHFVAVNGQTALYEWDGKLREADRNTKLLVMEKLMSEEDVAARGYNGGVVNLYNWHGRTGDGMINHNDTRNSPNLSSDDSVLVYSGGAGAVQQIWDKNGKLVKSVFLEENSLCIIPSGFFNFFTHSVSNIDRQRWSLSLRKHYSGPYQASGDSGPAGLSSEHPRKVLRLERQSANPFRRQQAPRSILVEQANKPVSVKSGSAEELPPKINRAGQKLSWENSYLNPNHRAASRNHPPPKPSRSDAANESEHSEAPASNPLISQRNSGDRPPPQPRSQTFSAKSGEKREVSDSLDFILRGAGDIPIYQLIPQLHMLPKFANIERRKNKRDQSVFHLLTFDTQRGANEAIKTFINLKRRGLINEGFGLFRSKYPSRLSPDPPPERGLRLSNSHAAGAHLATTFNNLQEQFQKFLRFQQLQPTLSGPWG